MNDRNECQMVINLCRGAGTFSMSASVQTRHVLYVQCCLDVES